MSGGAGSTVGVTVLADAAFEDVDKLLERLHVAAPNSVAVGGVVDEGAVMFLNDDVVRHGAVGTLVSGDFDIDTHVAHGARPVGPVMSLTQDNAVLELDDAPAPDAERRSNLCPRRQKRYRSCSASALTVPRVRLCVETFYPSARPAAWRLPRGSSRAPRVQLHVATTRGRSNKRAE